MARVSYELAYARRVQAHALRDAGKSIREISSIMNLPICSVQNYLATLPDSAPVDAIAQVLSMKSERKNAHRGTLELKAMADTTVSHRTLGRRISNAGLAKKGVHRLSTRAPYHTEAKPTKYLDMLQMDTKKLRVGPYLYELLVVRDVATGCTLVMHHTGTQLGMVHKVARVLAVFGGAPRVFQTDNGTTDFSMARRDLLRPWHKLVLSRGTERVQFIPEAEPRRNGSVESFNNWLQTEWDNHGAAENVDADSFDTWLDGRVTYYNFSKPLSTTGKIPASLSSGRFNPNVADYSIDFAEPTSGCVSFIRYVSRTVDHETGAIAAIAPVKAPGTVYVVPNELEGSYLRFDCHLDGMGLVYAPREVDTLQAIALGPKIEDRRFKARVDPGICIGSFASPFTNRDEAIVQIDFDASLVAGFVPTMTDPAAIMRNWKKVLKQAVPSLIPSDIQIVIGDEGCWQAFNRHGDLIWTEQTSPEVLEHARENL